MSLAPPTKMLLFPHHHSQGWGGGEQWQFSLLERKMLSLWTEHPRPSGEQPLSQKTRRKMHVLPCKGLEMFWGVGPHRRPLGKTLQKELPTKPFQTRVRDEHSHPCAWRHRVRIEVGEMLGWERRTVVVKQRLRQQMLDVLAHVHNPTLQEATAGGLPWVWDHSDYWTLPKCNWYVGSWVKLQALAMVSSALWSCSAVFLSWSLSIHMYGYILNCV